MRTVTFSPDQSLAERRNHYIETVLEPHFAEVCGWRKDVRSVLYLVSQYWSDNAMDEVHVRCLASARDTPKWPHRCEYPLVEGTDHCNYCGSGLPGPDVPYDPLFWRAFEPFCRENGSQQTEAMKHFVPFLLLQLGANGRTKRTHVGGVLRPWLESPQAPKLSDADLIRTELVGVVHAKPDALVPRQVLADYLQGQGGQGGQGEAWGELITLQVSENPRARRGRACELLARCLDDILGPINGAVGREALAVRQGFLDTAVIWWQDEVQLERLGNDPWWATLRHAVVREPPYWHEESSGFSRVPPAGIPNLLRLTDPDGKEFERLVQSGADIVLERLDLDATTDVRSSLVLVPGLKALGILNSVLPTQVRATLDALTALECVYLEVDYVLEVESWLTAFADGELPPSLVMCDALVKPGWEVRLQRRPHSRALSADIALTPGRYTDELASLLGDLVTRFDAKIRWTRAPRDPELIWAT